ncbi:MFS transporter [Altererythrobacter sp. ZODW24]|uniref:MFS transporter n=1 Tax=Altererythrobacter sp. ZODW24 TaxID=2185142 RepID=UPI000DF7EACB|nr:MFS transporter [Altererythrobacter sp. ZODW24]
MAEAVPHRAQSNRFLFLYALAAAGGAVAYVPLLTVLLPVQVTLLAGEQDVIWLSYLTFGGAIAASLTNIAFGWLSDFTGHRRRWIATGLGLSSMMLILIGKADTFEALIGLIVLWQIGLNLMLSPLAAWAGDCVPDHQKGRLGGLLAFSPALGALAGSFVTFPNMALPETRLALVAMIVAAMVLPVLLLGRPTPMPQLMERVEGRQVAGKLRSSARNVIAAMWSARLLVQIAEAALFAFLFIWLKSISPTFRDSDSAMVFSIALCIAVPIAMISGRLSDRFNRPIAPLVVFAALGAVGLWTMAMSTTLFGAIAGYLIFGITISVFLALHSSQTLRVLPRPQNRGRDLGLFNLTNTVPSLIMPWLTLLLVPSFGFSGLFVLLGSLCVAACALLAALAMRR